MIIGAALGAVVNSLVNDIIMPPIGYALGGVDFDQLKIVLKPGDAETEVAIRYGAFINAVITFVIVAFVVFWLGRMLIKEPDPVPTQTCPFCKEAVAAAATRCRYCTSELGA